MNSFFNLKGDRVIERKQGAFFIVFEGLDGSGQTTQAKILEKNLLEENYPSLYVKEPTSDSEPAERIHKALEEKEEISAQDLQLLFSQDREIHLKKVIYPALESGKIVIADRYFFTSFAYGSADGVDIGWLKDINKNFIYPDLTIYLRISAKEAIRRIIERGKPVSLFEKEEKLEKRGNIYSEFPLKFKDFYSIDAEKSREEVSEEVSRIFFKKFQTYVQANNRT